jgi:hypothetical protein
VRIPPNAMEKPASACAGLSIKLSDHQPEADLHQT